jgi:hypothetical protein
MELGYPGTGPLTQRPARTQRDLALGTARGPSCRATSGDRRRLEYFAAG